MRHLLNIMRLSSSPHLRQEGAEAVQEVDQHAPLIHKVLPTTYCCTMR